ncbi:MAG: GNAT family N-acetyltransferase [Planctomycetota bacterium]
MTQTPPSPVDALPEHAPQGSPDPRVLRCPPELWPSACARLIERSGEVGQGPGAIARAAKRFVDTAPAHGIDLHKMWVTRSGNGLGGPRVGQVCLLVCGPGHTGMLFLSPPGTNKSLGDEERQRSELAGCIDAAARAADTGLGDARLLQALPEPDDDWASLALESAGFGWVGDLDYLRRHVRPDEASGSVEGLSDGIELARLSELGAEGLGLLAMALDRSYEDTLDCPALCGLRDTEDVIASHRAVGQFDSSLWWILLKGGEAHGCVLLNPIPASGTLELVYIGLGPALRGQGIAPPLLRRAVHAAAARGLTEITCAVDQANAPARKLYDRHGFVRFSGRRAYVKRVSQPS